MENFRRPYFSTTVTEFWRRWHISLSTWFRDYLYFPMGGSRVSKVRTLFNVMVTFIVSGVWHGANWTFILWGTIHGVLQCVERLMGWNKAHWKGVPKYLHWALTFCIVCLAWTFFRANNISDAFTIINGIFTDFGKPYMQFSVFSAIAFALAAVFAKETIDEFGLKIRISNSPVWLVRHSYIVFMVIVILLFGVLDGGQFIYFQF